MLIGYARISSNDQDTAAQVAALKAAKCERIYREQASGGRWDRPELQRLLDQLRKGDVLRVAAAALVGSPQGTAPPRLPQIRTCGIAASGSSAHGLATWRRRCEAAEADSAPVA